MGDALCAIGDVAGVTASCAGPRAARACAGGPACAQGGQR